MYCIVLLGDDYMCLRELQDCMVSGMHPVKYVTYCNPFHQIQVLFKHHGNGTVMLSVICDTDKMDEAYKLRLLHEADCILLPCYTHNCIPDEARDAVKAKVEFIDAMFKDGDDEPLIMSVGIGPDIPEQWSKRAYETSLFEDVEHHMIAVEGSDFFAQNMLRNLRFFTALKDMKDAQAGQALAKKRNNRTI